LRGAAWRAPQGELIGGAPLDPAWTRDRIARVADWAWPFVEAHLRTVLPGEPIFRGVDRHQAGDVHRERGHRDVAMVAKVYGRFKRDPEERDLGSA
jgi:hypothetical protein